MTITRKDFEDLLEGFHKGQADYLRDCEEYREKGWRHHYCFHGTNMWTDYDPICGMCEESHPNERTTPEKARAWFNEWHGTSYDDDHLLGKFEPIAWGDDAVEVVKIHHYEMQRVGKVYPVDYHNVICTLALVSDGMEFEMVIGTDEMVIAV